MTGQVVIGVVNIQDPITGSTISTNRYMIESTLKIARYCPLVIQGFSNFLGLFQGIMANPALKQLISISPPNLGFGSSSDTLPIAVFGCH